LSRLLSQRWTVEAVSDGSAALAAARARPPDLVLADVMMPGMDGFELLRELRADARTRIVPIVLLSARAGEESRLEGLEAGADDYLVKPFSARELLARIGAHLDLARERRTALEGRQEHANRLRKLAEAGLAINSTLSLDDTLKLVTEQARDIVGAHQAITSMAVAESWAQAITAIDLSDKYAAWRSYQPASNSIGIDSLVRDQNHPLRLTQAELESHPAWQGLGAEAGRRLPMRGWLAAPLIARDGHNIGLIQLSDKYAGEFTEEDEAVLVQLAQMASVAIENARLYQEARGAAQAREELLSVVSHDLKNPLASIKGYAQLLRRRIERLAIPEATRLVDSLTKIDTASARMVGQIDELLDAARLSAGQPLDLSFERIDLVALIRQVATERQQTTQHHIIQVTTAVPELYGAYDAVRIERVFSNLIANAIKYSPDGGAIDVDIAQQQGDQSWAIVAVRDQGVGIPAADLPRIFERFHRAGNVARHIQGTGIGLSSARQIVEQHDGTIEVASQEGVGSTFTVRLPL
jgi:signal transduction histidine kinase